MHGHKSLKQNDSSKYNQEYRNLEQTYILRALRMFHDDKDEYYDYDDDDDDRKEANIVAEIPDVSRLT